jgi:hypothetical protein
MRQVSSIVLEFHSQSLQYYRLLLWLFLNLVPLIQTWDSTLSTGTGFSLRWAWMLSSWYVVIHQLYHTTLNVNVIQFEVVCFRERYRFKIPKAAALENVLQRVDRKKLLLLLDPASEDEYFDMASFLIVMASCDHPKVKMWLIQSPLVNSYQIHSMLSPLNLDGSS